MRHILRGCLYKTVSIKMHIVVALCDNWTVSMTPQTSSSFSPAVSSPSRENQAFNHPQMCKKTSASIERTSIWTFVDKFCKAFSKSLWRNIAMCYTEGDKVSHGEDKDNQDNGSTVRILTEKCRRSSKRDWMWWTPPRKEHLVQWVSLGVGSGLGVFSRVCTPLTTHL